MFKSIKKLFGNIFGSNKIEVTNLANREEIEEKLSKSDISPTTIKKIFDGLDTLDSEKIKESILSLCLNSTLPEEGVILLVGVNGSGKTTSIGKLLQYYLQKNKKPMVIAGDTFRAAAIGQLENWCVKSNVPLFKSEAKDAAAVAYQGCEEYKKSDNNILIVDTAGRLQDNVNLMKELEKVKRSINKVLPETKITTILTIDSLLGQNSVNQAKLFNENIGVDGVILTKMDGPAKGGTALTIMDQLKIPVVALSFGETAETLVPFEPQEYVNALIS